MKNKVILILIIIFGFIPSLLLAQDNLGASLPKVSNPIANPVLSVRIPMLNSFREATCDGKECIVPWIADYIEAIYQYGLAIIGILAVIVSMIAGVMWLTAGGKEEKIREAKNMISGSLLGVIIAISSYAILYIINPTLTKLSPIKVTYIENIDMQPMTIAADELDGTSDSPNEQKQGTSGTSETHCGCPWDIQFNYASVTYPPGGNIKSHGCGAVSSWDLVKCKGKSYTLEAWIKILDSNGVAAGSSGSTGSNMPKALKSAGLQTAYFDNLKDAGKKMDEMKDKNPMMVIGVRGVNKGGSANCQFTKNGHFIFGVKKEGNSLCINDPSNSKGMNSRKDADISQISSDCKVTGVTVAW